MKWFLNWLCGGYAFAFEDLDRIEVYNRLIG